MGRLAGPVRPVETWGEGPWKAGRRRLDRSTYGSDSEDGRVAALLKLEARLEFDIAA